MKVVSTEALTRALGLIKTELGKKEPNITKKTGFNLDKTDTVQNNPSILFTTKGAFDLKTELVNSINTKMDKAGGTFTGKVGVPTGFKVGEVDVIGTSDSVTRFGDSSRELNLNCSSGIINVLNNGRVYHQGFKPTLTDIGIPNVKNVSLNWSLGSAAPTHIWGSQGDANQSYVYNGSQLKTFIGLSNVNNWGSSNELDANSATEYATTGMVKKVRDEKLTKISGYDYNFNFTKTLVANTWTETGVSAGIAQGTYLLEFYSNNTTKDNHWDETYVGIFHWFAGSTNSGEITEIALSSAGHSNGGKFYTVGFKRVGSSSGLTKQIVIACNQAVDAGSYRIRLKRIA
ncbi:MAG: hypothetical protein ACRC92_25660 [Peptostreptococcaceae bacterium]